MIENTSRTVDVDAPIHVGISAEQVEEQRRRVARIKRAIRRRTHGGVQGLSVEMNVDSLLLRGRCASFYCKQVAQQAAMSFLPSETIVNQIEVDSRPR